MDKKSMAIILAAMGLSAGSGLAMEKPETQHSCADKLSSDDLNELFSKGDFIMPGTYQAFIFSSGNRSDLVKKFKEQESSDQSRVGILEGENQEQISPTESTVTCHYTYRGGMGMSIVPSYIMSHTKFTVTSVSSGTEILPQMQQEESSTITSSEKTFETRYVPMTNALYTKQDFLRALKILSMQGEKYEDDRSMQYPSPWRDEVLEEAKAQFKTCLDKANQIANNAQLKEDCIWAKEVINDYKMRKISEPITKKSNEKVIVMKQKFDEQPTEKLKEKEIIPQEQLIIPFSEESIKDPTQDDFIKACSILKIDSVRAQQRTAGPILSQSLVDCLTKAKKNKDGAAEQNCRDAKKLIDSYRKLYPSY